MAHIHNVIDTDKHFIIDAVTMTIQNTSDKVKLSQYNHRSERFTFECPRYIDGHDMSTCNKVQVHFNNVKGDKTVISKGVYEVDDLEVSPADENTVLFTWLISRKATLNEGTLNFCIRFACIGEDATVEYARYTDIHKGITISESLFNSEHIIADYSDVLEAWKKELEELAVSGGGLTEVAWEDIKNKPFGEIKPFDDVIYDETVTDRVVTESFLNQQFNIEVCFAKVAELPVAAIEYLSMANSLTFNTGDESEIFASMIFNVNNGVAIGNGYILLIVAVDVANTEIDGIIFPESGLYFLWQKSGQMGVQKVTFKKSITPIDEKYMPESYKNIKEYLNEHEKTSHLPEVTSEDSGKIAMVNGYGKWVAEKLAFAEEGYNF